MQKRQEALKKETFWLDVRGNTFTTTSQAVEQAAQKVLHSLTLKILKTRLNKTLNNMVWPYSSPCFGQSNRTRNLSSFLPFWIILWSDEITFSQIKRLSALNIYKSVMLWVGFRPDDLWRSFATYVISGFCGSNFLAKWHMNFSHDYSKYFWLQQRYYATLVLLVQDKILSAQTCLITLELFSSCLPQAFFPSDFCI